MKKMLMMTGMLLFGAATLFGQKMVRIERFTGEELTGIDVSVLDVEIRQGTQTGVVVEIEDDDKLIRNFYCKMEKPGVVKMGMYARSKQNVKAYITVSRLDMLHATNMSVITPVGAFTSPDVCNVSLYNRARLDGLEITADSVRVKSSHNANISDLRVNGRRGILLHASGGGTLSCDGVFESGYANVWAATGTIYDLNLRVKNADLNVIKGGNIRGLTVNSPGRITVMAEDFADVNFKGSSRAGTLDLKALNSALVTGVDVQADEISLESNYYSSIEPVRLSSSKPLKASASNRSRIKGGGVDEVNKSYSGRNKNAGSWFWGGYNDKHYRRDKDVEMVRVTRFRNQQLYGLRVDHFFQVVLRQGDDTGLEVILPEELSQYLTCTIEEGNIVRIGFNKLPSPYRQNGSLIMRNQPKITITVNRLEILRLSNMCRLTGEGHFTSPGKVRIDASDLSKINGLRLDAQEIHLSCNDMSKAKSLVLNAPEVKLAVADMSGIEVTDADIGTLRLSAHDMSKIRIAGRAKKLASLVSRDLSKIDYRALKVENR